jgi:hypothetical protein
VHKLHSSAPRDAVGAGGSDAERDRSTQLGCGQRKQDKITQLNIMKDARELFT